MELDPTDMGKVANRLKRAQGQLAAVVRMLDEGRDCEDVVTQLSAVSRALDRAGFAIIASGMRQCLTEPAEDGEDPTLDVAKLEALPLARLSATAPDRTRPAARPTPRGGQGCGRGVSARGTARGSAHALRVLRLGAERRRELALVQPGVGAARREQLVVRALLDDRAVLHDEDRVRVADRRGGGR